MTAESGPAHELTDMLRYLVKNTHRRLNAATDAALRPTGVDLKEFGVLWVLAAHEPLSQQGVAARVNVDPTTMVSLIDGLESRGILTRKPDPSDRRRNALELTAAGHSIYRNAESAFIDAEEKFLSPLSATQITQLRGMLRALIESADTES